MAMSKQKMIFFIETKLFEVVQQLSLYVYNSTIKDKKFNFNRYFDSTYEETISSTLEVLIIIDVDNYRDIYYKYLYEVYDMSKTNAIMYMKADISNRKLLNEYWLKNKKLFLSEIVTINKTEMNKS